MEFKSLFLRLKILSVPQQDYLPGNLSDQQAAPFFALGAREGHSYVFTWRISENAVSINSEFCNNLLLTKHFDNILLCILALALFVSYSSLTVPQGFFSSGSQLFFILLAAAKPPQKLAKPAVCHLAVDFALLFQTGGYLQEQIHLRRCLTWLNEFCSTEQPVIWVRLKFYHLLDLIYAATENIA